MISKDTDLKFIMKAFPLSNVNDIKVILEKLTYDKFNYHETTQAININNKTMDLPYRIYYHELAYEEIKDLTDIQIRILYCLFTRHNNGYIRQKYLNKLLKLGDLKLWEIAYIISLCGEYVIEIIDDIHANWNLINIEKLTEFIYNNSEYIITIEGRIASYWGEYYMYINKKDYSGFKIQKRLKKLRRSIGK
ncbi:hypothetical protein [Wukongibacter baidiensis]